jgi:hypothetical protein
MVIKLNKLKPQKEKVIFCGKCNSNSLNSCSYMLRYLSSLILLLCVTAWSLQAQVLDFTSDTVMTTGFSSDYEIIANSNLDNLSANDHTIVWRRVVNNLPNGWTSSVCDKNACWYYSTDSKTFLLPGSRGEKLDVNFYPNNNTGTATVELLAYVQGDSTNTVVRATYKATAEQPSSVVAAKKNLNINIYPNPVKDMMMVKGLLENQTYKVELYSILGTKINSYTLAAGTAQGGIHEVDVNDLPKGVYMVRILDKGMNLIFNKSISKIK